MTAAEFDAILADRLRKTREVLASKAGEYATDADRLHNFKRAAKEFGDWNKTSYGVGTGEAAALLGMLRKHWTSIADLADQYDSGRQVPPEFVDEKIGDAVNYLILLEALLRE